MISATETITPSCAPQAPCCRPTRTALALRVGLFLGLLFGAAGRLDWWPGWAFFGLRRLGARPAGAALLLLVIRTELEDRTLRRELEGYADYAKRVRFRLLPGVW